MKTGISLQYWLASTVSLTQKRTSWGQTGLGPDGLDTPVCFGSNSPSHTFLTPPLITSKQVGWMVSWGKGPHPPVPGPPTSLLFDLLHPVSHEAQFLFYFRTLFTVDSFSCPFSPFSTIFLNNRLIPILLCLKLLSCKISHLYIREKGVVPGTIFQHFKNSSRGLIIFIALDVYFKYCQWAGSA